MKSIEKIIVELKELAGKNLSDFLDKLQEVMRSDSINFNYRINLYHNFHENENNKLKGIISMQEYTLEKNIILNNCLELCERIKVEDLLLDTLQEASDNNDQPFFERDIIRVDKDHPVKKIIKNKTIIIVVGTHIFPELTDRVSGEILRDIINKQGNYGLGKRAILLNDKFYLENIKDFKNNPVISIGGERINKQTLAIEMNPSLVIAEKTTRIVYLNIDQPNLQVALTGVTASDTKNAVSTFIISNNRGLSYFIETVWQ